MRNYKNGFLKYLCCAFTGILYMAFSGPLFGQAKASYRGIVVDSATNLPISGVSVLISGTRLGTSTDNKGQFLLEYPQDTLTLKVTFIGYAEKDILASNGESLRIALTQSVDTTGEGVVVVAYGKQKKISMVAAVSSVDPKELHGTTSNLTQMLAGRIPGMIAYQRSGAPGADNASFFIRGVGSFGAGKVDPLILIDGIESSNNDLGRLQPDDIAGFSVLKDAAASALYGARGANGVVLVTTKTGTMGKSKFDVRLEAPISMNTEHFKFTDNVTYMNLANEAVLTRDPLGVLPYSQEKIDKTKAGADPYRYPNNDWISQLIKDVTVNQKANISASGGGKVAQYYVAGTYNVDNGVLREVPGNSFNNNIKKGNYNVRANITVNFTKSTKFTVRTYAQFDQYTGPNGGGDNVFNQAIWSNPVMFPAYYPASFDPNAAHPLFGNAYINNSTNLYTNPFANMVSGFQQYNSSTINVQGELSQGLEFITKGLSTRVMGYTQRYSYFDLTRAYKPFYYTLLPDGNGDLNAFTPLNKGQGTEYLNYSEGNKVLNTTNYIEWATNYNRTFAEKHDVGGMVIGILQSRLNANAGDLQSSLPGRNIGVSGRFTYAYDGRYLSEFNFGYNGSERFAKNNRFGFFPSFGLGWVVSKEKFFEPLKGVISLLKFRGTYGLVGNDQIGNASDRFFYLSNVNPNDDGRGYHFGINQQSWVSGYSISRYANSEITWERAKTLNYGMDLTFQNGISIEVDAYKSTRSDILMQRSTVPNTMGLEADIYANVGKVSSKGVDVALNYNKNFSNQIWLQARGTFTYATNRYLVNEEPMYPANLSYLSHVGNSINQMYGFIAERLFVDDLEAINSPTQSFGGSTILGGDIKYRDVNGDGKIDDNDKVPLGFPTIPEIQYGFGFSFGYKAFDISAFFQGTARTSFMINVDNISPFVLNGGSQNGLLQVIADSHWSEDNQDIRAFWPRLDDNFNNNNHQSSSWWLQNGAYLRLKTVEVGYNLPKSLLERLHFTKLRVYANGMNLFVISAFKLWDPEMGSNGLGYPIQKQFNLGVNFGF